LSEPDPLSIEPVEPKCPLLGGFVRVRDVRCGTAGLSTMGRGVADEGADGRRRDERDRGTVDGSCGRGP